ncbi:DUF397 domain-containing protein [Nocardia fusca]|uniref:DUF397 domain-containing protein n=1 Tax=Nocardia fusca TaxID=941183 RepID=UPI0007A73176|nr:DUF397 domain-containing protein [Nocardia fusca]
MSTTETVNALRTGWFKSSRSNDGPNCVEVNLDADPVLIRDSKYLRDPANNPQHQPVITVPADRWAVFLDHVVGQLGEQPLEVPSLPAIHQHSSGEVSITAADGATLTYTPPEWAAFVAGIHDGEFSAGQATMYV